jgi:CDGSH-type Zn-finger protein
MLSDNHGGADHIAYGKVYEHTETTHLCRCGYSENKPFCDGTHTKVGFEGTEFSTKEPYEEGAMYYQ